MSADDLRVRTRLEDYLPERDASRAGPGPGRDRVGRRARFLAGEESALASLVSGGPAVPRFTPPRVFDHGVDGRPTLVQNVETLAHLALIARYGPGWFRGDGHAGRARHHAVHAAAGQRLGRRCRGRDRHAARHAARPAGSEGGWGRRGGAVLVGGYHGAWLPAAQAARLTLSNAALRPVGAFTGAGVLAALPADRCGLIESARVARYLALESAGQCGPCLNGLPSIAAAMAELAGRRHPRPAGAGQPEPLGGPGRGARRLPSPRRNGPVPAQRAERVRAGGPRCISRAAVPPRRAGRSCRFPPGHPPKPTGADGCLPN